MSEPRASEVPNDWQPGDSGMTIDDSTVTPPSLARLEELEREAKRREPRERDDRDPNVPK